MVLEMNRILGSEPAFHVVPGDYDYTSQTNAELQANALVKTWYMAPGNHDDNIGSLPNTSMDRENARLIFLNEYVCPAGLHDNSLGRVCSHTLSWLTERLTNAPSIVFVIGHEPAFPENRHTTDSLNYYPAERDAFWSLINQHGVHSYICGHTHYYSTYSDSTGSTVQIDLGNAGNPGDPEQTFAVFDVSDSGVSWRVYQGLRNQPFDGGTQASDPVPADGAMNVAVTTSLSWTPAASAVSHRLFLAGSLQELQQQTDPAYSGSAASYDPEPDLNAGTTYWWRVDEVFAGSTVAGSPWSFTTKELLTVRRAASETTAKGSTAGGLAATQDRDNAYEVLTEVLSATNKNGYSVLEHVWRFDNVPAAANLQLRVEAHRTAGSDGDSFELSYSADGSTYTSALTVTKTADNNVEQILTLPSSLHGTVWVKAQDTDRIRAHRSLDTLYVDCLYLASSDGTIPDIVVPITSGGPTGTMHVGNLTGVGNLRGGNQWTATVTVRIDDQNAGPVSGAIVNGTWSGAINAVAQGTTGSNGTVALNSGNIKSGTSVTFTVDNVTHTTLTYDPANTTTSVTIDKPQ